MERTGEFDWTLYLVSVCSSLGDMLTGLGVASLVMSALVCFYTVDAGKPAPRLVWRLAIAGVLLLLVGALIPSSEAAANMADVYWNSGW